MRADQYEKLQALTERLTDVFLTEADPEKWPGRGIEPNQWDQQTRGDRYWSKKNAAATLTVIMRTTSLIGVIQQRSTAGADGDPAAVQDEKPEEDSLDADIRAAEREAAKLINQAQKYAAKGGKLHGKA